MTTPEDDTASDTQPETDGSGDSQQASGEDESNAEGTQQPETMADHSHEEIQSDSKEVATDAHSSGGSNKSPATDQEPGDGGPESPDTDNDPARDRRRFLQAIGLVGVGAGAAYYFGFRDGDDDGFDPVSPDDPGPEIDHEHIPDEWSDFTLPATQAATEYDVSYTEETKLIEGEEIEAVVDADLDEHTYVFEEAELEQELESGDVLIISGVSLRRITETQLSNGQVIVETELAALSDAIESGTVAWESEFGYDEAFDPDRAEESFGPLDSRSPGPIAGSSDEGRLAGFGLSSTNVDQLSYTPSGRDKRVATAGNLLSTPPSPASEGGSESPAIEETLGQHDDDEDSDDIRLEDPQLSWTASDGDNVAQMTFELETMEDGASVMVHTQFPADAEAKGAFGMRLNLGSLKCDCKAEFSDEELDELKLEENLDAEIEVSSAHAATGSIDMDVGIPWPVFTWVIFVGPIPITFQMLINVSASIDVPNEASATFDGRISFDGTTTIDYEDDVEAHANIAGLQLAMTEESHAAAQLGNSVNAQFALGFPRLQVGVAGDTFVPYLVPISTFGSMLHWTDDGHEQEHFTGLVVEAGYNFNVFGVDLLGDSETLFHEYDHYTRD